MTKILFCTDGSDVSLFALYNLTDWMKNVEVDILTVIDWNFLPEGMHFNKEEYMLTYERLADSILNMAEKELTEREIKVGNKLKSVGSTVQEILNQSTRNHYDIVCLGSNGKKGIQKWLGAVSYQVAYNMKLPVFIGKRYNAAKRILLTTDGLENTTKSIQHALKYLDLTNKEVHLLSISEVNDIVFVESSIDSQWVNNLQAEQNTFLRTALDNIEKLLEKKGVYAYHEKLEVGNPSELILKYIMNNSIDLVITGSHSKKSLSSLVMGSVSRRVLEHTLSDILIVKGEHV